MKLRPSPDQVKQLTIFGVNKKCSFDYKLYKYIDVGFLHSARNDPILSCVCVLRASQAENDYLNDINTECYQSITMQLAVHCTVNTKQQ